MMTHTHTPSHTHKHWNTQLTRHFSDNVIICSNSLDEETLHVKSTRKKNNLKRRLFSCKSTPAWSWCMVSDLMTSSRRDVNNDVVTDEEEAEGDWLLIYCAEDWQWHCTARWRQSPRGRVSSNWDRGQVWIISGYMAHLGPHRRHRHVMTHLGPRSSLTSLPRHDTPRSSPTSPLIDCTLYILLHYGVIGFIAISWPAKM